MRACGAVAPYTEILGGKLVTALVTSKETRSLYRRRYGNQVSEIASQLAGRPITRSAELAILTTTSLYGVSSSQYNRLVLRPEHCSSLTHEIRWEDLGLSAGFGTAHMSLSTSESLLEVAIERWGIRKVNHIFGEGASPRLRKIREGLDALGITSGNILNHSTPRRIYACELTPGIRDRLMGFGPSKRRLKAPSAEAITEAWRVRWLGQRVRRDLTLEKLKSLGEDSIRMTLWADENGQYRLPLTVAA